MKILGLDTSTKTGAVVLRFVEPGIDCPPANVPPVVMSADEITVKKGRTGLDRCSDIAEAMLAIMKANPPDMVVVEDYGFANAHTLATLVEVSTVLRYFLRQEGHDFLLVAPTMLKKFIAGKGNVKKDVMRLETFKRFEFEHVSDNVVDAFGLAVIGGAVAGVCPCLTKAQTEVRDKLRANRV